MKLLNKVLVGALGIFFSLSANAAGMSEGFYVNLGLSYDSYSNSETTDPGTGEETDSRTSSDLLTNFSGGYSLGNGFLIGAKYYAITTSWNTEAADGTTAEGTYGWSTMGVLGGYVHNEFLFQFSYLLLDPPSYKQTWDNGNNEIEYKDGSGWILDFMYMLGSSNFKFGPQLSYVRFEYSVRDVNGTEDPEFVSLVESWIVPQFAITATF